MIWEPGQSLYGGRYKIEKQIGAGGMGVAYLARNRQGQKVVIKTLREQILKSTNAQRFCNRFKDEALKLSLCRHPHIVTIENAFSEILTIANQEIEVPYLAMEFIEGENLAERVEKLGRMTELEALMYIYQIGDALNIVHDKGLLHRDIKPSNIMLRKDKEEAVLIDFGLARGFVANSAQQVTIAFTHGYAPPEQYSEKVKVGEFVDVYALAATLYFLLTGTTPVSAMDRMMKVPLVSIRQVNSLVSEQTSDAVAKGMELSIVERPPTVMDWLKLLPSVDNISPPPKATVPAAAPPDAPPQQAKASLESLDYYLARHQWREADRVTALLLCSAAKKEKEGSLTLSDIHHLPSYVLFSIDRLWTKYSQGHFGFRVQRQLWQSLHYKWGPIEYEAAQEFGKQIGWYTESGWIEYRQVQFSSKAPKGHLPSWRAGGKVVSWVAGRLGYFLNRWQ